MSHKYKFRNPDAIYFVTFSVVKWVDVFTRDEYRNILIDSFIWCQINKGLVIHAWVIMTNHIHLIISKNDKIPLEDIMRDMKKYTAVEILKAIKTNIAESRKKWMLMIFLDAGSKNINNEKFQFWQNGNHPIELDNNTMIEQRLNYLHENPVKQGFVNLPEYYRWSSAIDYAGGKGLIKLQMIE